MNITQLKNKVKECGGKTRAYWSAKNVGLDIFGFRGDLIIKSNDELIFDLDGDYEESYVINNGNWVHAPAIGHYSW